MFTKWKEKDMLASERPKEAFEAGGNTGIEIVIHKAIEKGEWSQESKIWIGQDMHGINTVGAQTIKERGAWQPVAIY